MFVLSVAEIGFPGHFEPRERTRYADRADRAAPGADGHHAAGPTRPRSHADGTTGGRIGT